LRFPRALTVVVSAGTAAITLGLSAAPASADQVRSAEWWLGSLGVTNVWPASQGAGVTVAVLSDGVVSSQPDLTGAVTTAPAIPAAPVAVSPFFGEQGTAISSLIAGRGHGANSGSGVIGVAPEAQILSVPVTVPADDWQLGQQTIASAIPAAIAAGIKYAVNHGASVIDLPADPGQPNSNGVGGSAAAAGGSPAEQAAVSYALAHNVVLVAPAGDDALTTSAINYPAAYPGVIAVGAFDSAIDKPPWTSHRSYVTLTAAGAGVMAATNSGGYQPMNSTTAASAVVAGVVALIRSRYPGLSVANVRKALITTTRFRRPNGLTNGSGYGALDAAKALTAAAALSTPTEARAGAGAQPRVTSLPTAAGTGGQSLTSQIVRAGEISAGVLVVLLLIASGYALTGRRRRPSSLPATMAAQWTSGHTQSRYPHAPLTDGDRMLELFAAPVSTPDRPAELGEASLPAPFAGDPWREGDLFAAMAPTDEAAPPTTPGPASRAVASRAAVSGAPPWEAAPQPEGELPWSDAPARQTVAGEVVASGYPPASPPSHDSGPGFDLPDARTRGHLTTAPAPGNGWPTRGGRSDRLSSERLSSERLSSERLSSDRLSSPEQADWPRAEAPSPWMEAVDRPDPAGGFAEASDSNQHRSGLPIRQPRPVTRPPLSPSGSLWERAEPTHGADPAETTDASGRPIFIGDRAWSEDQ
jgi:hypothetical protein